MILIIKTMNIIKIPFKLHALISKTVNLIKLIKSPTQTNLNITKQFQYSITDTYQRHSVSLILKQFSPYYSTHS